MSDGEISGRDLFGDVVVEPKEGRGRPEHRWSRENSNRVLLAFVRGLSVRQAATSIGVSVPTLRKHYSAEVAQRQVAALRFEIRQFERLNLQAEAGNVAAEKELFKRLDKARLESLADRVAHNVKPHKAVKQGKKAEQKEAAASVRGRFAPPPLPPDLLN